jgi:psp operon transcriptional activator
MAKTLEHPVFPGFSTAAERRLLEYGWPGNVRELRNVVERAVYRAGPGEAPIDTIQIDPFASPWRPGGAQASGATSLPALPSDFAAAVAGYESDLLRRGLARGGGNQAAAAQLLGLGYHQLRRLLRKHRI